jgi:hypothetical protein
MTGISQTPNQELRDVKKGDNHRNFTTSMWLIIRNVNENPFFIQFPNLDFPASRTTDIRYSLTPVSARNTSDNTTELTPGPVFSGFMFVSATFGTQEKIRSCGYSYICRTWIAPPNYT